MPASSAFTRQFDARNITAADASSSVSADPIVPPDNAIAPVIDLGSELSFPSFELERGIREDERRGWLADFVRAGGPGESRFGKLRIHVPERSMLPFTERPVGRALAAQALSSPAGISVTTPIVRT